MPIIDVRQLFSKQWYLQVILDNATVYHDAYKWKFDHFFYVLWCLQVISGNSCMDYDAYTWS